MLLTAANHNLPVLEFTPIQVKQSVVGFGSADKKQVQFMVKHLLNLRETPKPDDVADALAMAICGLHTASSAGCTRRQQEDGRSLQNDWFNKRQSCRTTK